MYTTERCCTEDIGTCLATSVAQVLVSIALALKHEGTTETCYTLYCTFDSSIFTCARGRVAHAGQKARPPNPEYSLITGLIPSPLPLLCPLSRQLGPHPHGWGDRPVTQIPRDSPPRLHHRLPQRGFQIWGETQSASLGRTFALVTVGVGRLPGRHCLMVAGMPCPSV